MINILVNCDSMEEAICRCKFLASTIYSKRIAVKKVTCKTNCCRLQTEHIVVEYVVCKGSNDSIIKGKHCDLVYGFNKDISLYLTRGKSEGPTLPLLDQIVWIEKGENND